MSRNQAPVVLGGGLYNEVMARTGRPPVYVGCSVQGCERKHLAKSFCAMHYKRLTRSGAVGSAEFQEKQINCGPCGSPNCDRPAITKGYCEAHYQRLLRGNGDVATPIGRKRKPGTGGRWINNHGYVILTLPGDGGRRVSEHRHIMEQRLGRRLRSDESVHHINGIRTDNRPENLELWARIQPSGQRVSDLLAWANEIIDRYG